MSLSSDGEHLGNPTGAKVPWVSLPELFLKLKVPDNNMRQTPGLDRTQVGRYISDRITIPPNPG